MRYYVSLSPDPAAPPTRVDVDEMPDGSLRVRMGDRDIAVDSRTLGDVLSLHIDGRVVDLTVEGSPPDLGLIARGSRSYVRVESERMKAANAARQGGNSGREKLLRSPMPGRIVKVNVVAGDTVAAGQVMLVVEAMKMENEVKAKAAGAVGEVFVKAGDTVEGNGKLLAFA
jgi:biotin carboxyl carrier protein